MPKLSNTQQPLPLDHPIMIVWRDWHQSEEAANAKKWALFPEHTDGSLWCAFLAGYMAGCAEENGSL